MQQHSDYKELARRYGLPPVPDSVIRLTQMVARQDCDLEQIAQAIAQDPALEKRLLRLANPGALTPADYTVDSVEAALFRRGIGCALLLAMSTPLALALARTFQTMLDWKLETVDLTKVEPLDSEQVLGAIGFSGKATGSVCLRMASAAAGLVATRILGLEQPPNAGEINDAVGELLNIVTGNFKSHLCDAGLDCRLEPPKVWRATKVNKPTVPGASFECLAFRASQMLLFVDVAVNPWSQE
jgi:CheY-specific phosphatase CheX